MRKRQTVNGIPIEENLIRRLSPAALDGLDAQLCGWPHEPLPSGHLQDVIARAMTAAREILRLYPWKPCPDDHADPWPWRAVRHADLGWRPVGPDWTPAPSTEFLVCPPEVGPSKLFPDPPFLPDPPSFYPDLRPLALDWLYWLAALREAITAEAVALAAWRAADARADLWKELQLGWVINTGTKQRWNVAMNRPNRDRRDNTDWAPRIEADKRLEAEGETSSRKRARDLTGPGHMFPNVSAHHFRLGVAKRRKESCG